MQISPHMPDLVAVESDDEDDHDIEAPAFPHDGQLPRIRHEAAAGLKEYDHSADILPSQPASAGAAAGAVEAAEEEVSVPYNLSKYNSRLILCC
jgi:hypothetical protein